MHCARSSSRCSGMQCIYARFTRGVYLPSIYMHCTRSSSRCSGMQGIYAWLTGGSRSSSGCCSMQGIYAQLTGGFICLPYICIVLDLAVGVAVCNASMLDRWGVHLPSIYICIVLDLAVGVVVCKASLLDWLGGPSVFYIYALY